MTQVVKPENYTVEGYLDLEVNSPERHEYVNGEVRLREAGAPNHNTIFGNLAALLKLTLKDKAYDVFIVDQRLWIPACEVYTYPDIMVVEKPLVLQTRRTDTVTNPCFIAEVLSKSTKDYDRGDKFLNYRTIPTFREYLLLDQYAVHVEHYVKTAPNQWLMSEYDSLDATLSFETFDCQVNVADLYDGIDFAETQ